MALTSPSFQTLTKRRDFLAAARARKAVTKGFILQCRARPETETEQPVLRIGYTASKKVGNAVLRNRAKRRLRALAREILVPAGDPNCDYVFIARSGSTVDRPFDALRTDLTYALSKLGQGRPA